MIWWRKLGQHFNHCYIGRGKPCLYFLCREDRSLWILEWFLNASICQFEIYTHTKTSHHKQINTNNKFTLPQRCLPQNSHLYQLSLLLQWSEPAGRCRCFWVSPAEYEGETTGISPHMGIWLTYITYICIYIQYYNICIIIYICVFQYHWTHCGVICFGLTLTCAEHSQWSVISCFP